VIGLGTAIVFNVGQDETKRAELREVVAALLNGGGALIDTASSYGSSEQVVGAIATGTALRDRIFVATKLEARGGQEARDELTRSLSHLQTTQLDLLMLHNVRESDPGLDFFREVKSEGLTRYFGATTTSQRDYKAMETLIRREKPDFVEVDCSIANREAEARIIPAAADAGAAVLVALPFGRSSLFGAVRGKPLPPVAEEIGAVSWGQVFLKYLLGNPAITAIIPGTNKAEHMADNLGAGHGIVPDAKQRQALINYFEQLR
jgi:aryl-alcohol dehydrogenase-like predicted oxidoreductase